MRVTVEDIDFDIEVGYPEVYVAKVSVKGVDITDAINDRWLDKIDHAMMQAIERENEENKRDAELDSLEAWGV